MGILSSRVGSLIASGLLALVSIAFYQPMVDANEVLLAQMSDHCKVGNTIFVAVQNQDPDGSTAPTAAADAEKDGTGCQITTPGATDAGANWYTVNGNAIPVATAVGSKADVTGGKWIERPAELNLFGNITGTVINLIPIFLIVSMIMGPVAQAFAGGGDWKQGLYTRLGMLVAVVVAIYLVSPIMTQLNSASVVTDANTAYRSTGDFGSLLEIVFAAVYLVLLLGIVALIGYQGVRDVRAISGGARQLGGKMSGQMSGSGMGI